VERILIVAAHPDDEVLGCGGVMARFAAQGSQVFTLILGEGATSRDKGDAAGVERLRVDAAKANEILGVKELFFGGLADNAFDSVRLLDVIKKVEEVKAKLSPTAVFTHWAGDLNIDHKITNQAVLTAFRPMQGEACRDIFAFYTLSSSEWNFPNVFAPNAFFDISKTLNAKLDAMAVYSGELRNAPHPRSLEGIQNLARLTGQTVGLSAAEGFVSLRSVV